MAVRLLDAPGVEIHEIDKSQYTPSMSGTKCYVMGFANKGEPYIPMQFTSKSAWLNFYGEPDNEAERYFYNACSEVINQNGTLYCARLPYKNESMDKMVAYEFKVGTTQKNISETGLSRITEFGGVEKCIEIEATDQPYLEHLSAIDEYRTGEQLVTSNRFMIVDKTCATLGKVIEDDRKGAFRELLGIFPVVTTAANALYVQSMINVSDEEVSAYEPVTGTKTMFGNELLSSDMVIQFSNKDNNIEENGVLETISIQASQLFPTITLNSEQDGYDRENLKKIGLVIYKAYLDPSEGNKVNVTPVEAFVGSLDKDAVNPNTGVTTFLDTIVNSQSEYIYFFSNCFRAAAAKNAYDEADILAITNPSTVGMLGFYEEQTEEKISVSESILKGMETCFTKVNNIDEREIDVVCDAGVSNIAQFLKKVYDSTPGFYDLTMENDGTPVVSMWKCKSREDVKMWKTVIQKFDNFCKNVRKDCMFACDGPRPLVLDGQKKIVRESKPQNTIDANILPYVKWVTGLNTNYGAGYLDWFQIADDFTGEYFWCPPSIKAMGVYINTDLNFQYWDAPAGLNRGLIQALDVAFSPTNQQAGPIYTKSWNYAIDFPNDGITLWGQRTLQTKPSALDRINVRRLCLRLERQVYKVSRYFLFEGNTAYTRQRLIDLLTPVFQQAKVGGGLYDFKIVCDESNNTPTTIDNNELHLSIGIKPTKTIEFIIVNFTILSTGGSWDEME